MRWLSEYIKERVDGCRLNVLALPGALEVCVVCEAPMMTSCIKQSVRNIHLVYFWAVPLLECKEGLKESPSIYIIIGLKKVIRRRSSIDECKPVPVSGTFP
jgi:hypothetical protein